MSTARHPSSRRVTSSRRAPAQAPILAALLAAIVGACAGAIPVATPAPGSAGPGTGTGTATPATPATTDPTASPAATATPRPAPIREPGLARLEPATGTAFGLNIDWGSQTAADAAERLGVVPAVWVQFAAFPLDAGGRANLDAFIEQVAAVGGRALITLEPHGGLATVTDAAAADLADLLAGYWDDHGVATYVRFAHEMNGSWYAWSQQPEAYIEAFRRVAAAVHERSPASAMVWAPNQGHGYPFGGGRHQAAPGSPDAERLDTDGDGAVTGADDPYAPYYPGDDAVDWVGMSLYHWGLAYPWGENELPRPGTFAALVRGEDVGAHAGGGSVPDFYATYVEGRDKPMAIIETAILYDPAATSGPSEAAMKSAWFEEVLGDATRADFPRLRMIDWFEWRKPEPEVGRVIDWRLAADPDLARKLLAGVAPGWLRFADTDTP